MKSLIFILSSLLLSSCVTTGSANKPAGDQSGGILSSAATCAKTKVSEGLLAIGFAATVPNPLAPVAAAGYYAAVLYQCDRDNGMYSKKNDAIEQVRSELQSQLARVKAESIKASSSQIDVMNAKLDGLKASEMENADRVKRRAADIAAEAEATIRKASDKALADFYKHLDELRNVKIQVIDDEEN